MKAAVTTDAIRLDDIVYKTVMLDSETLRVLAEETFQVRVDQNVNIGGQSAAPVTTNTTKLAAWSDQIPRCAETVTVG